MSWYNWLYSQLPEYETYIVCPPGECTYESAAEALTALDNFEVTEIIQALPTYLVNRLIVEGRRIALRLATELFRAITRGLILGG